MANRYRGEVDVVLSGRTYTMCLTLGALAELEDACGVDGMQALAERFCDGRLSAKDAIRVLGAGLRGGGAEVADAEVAKMTVEGGAAGFAAAVVGLLTATFGAGGGDPS